MVLKHGRHIVNRCPPLVLKSSNNKSHGRSSPDYCSPHSFRPESFAPGRQELFFLISAQRFFIISDSRFLSAQA
jgi:hypothetical protein